jgi:PST family polysaccharide transporter
VSALQQGAGGSYREILRASALIGGSTLVGVAIGILRVKALALLLGTAGFGLYATYMAIVELARNVAQFGMNASGVREIAAAAARGDTTSLARTARVLLRCVLVCGLIGAALLAALAPWVSELTFGSNAHAGGLSALALAVLFGVVAGGYGALLQGLRRVGDVARVAIHGALLGALCAVALVAWLGAAGVVPALVASAAMSLLVSWHYGRQVPLADVPLSPRQTLREARALLTLGLAFLASGLLTMGAAYAVRVLIVRSVGLEEAGLYGAAWTLGGLYVGFILQALGTDFYPRLVAAAHDDALNNRLVNEQAEVGLLLALPGVLATLGLAPLVLTVFYSAAFADAAHTLRWICLGMALRVFTFPLGYIAVARNRQRLFFAMDLAWTVANVALSWWGIERWGASGAGLAFFASYVLHATIVLPVARRLTGFRWSQSCARTAAGCAALVATAFATGMILSPGWSLAAGALIALVGSAISARVLLRLVPPDQLPRALRSLRNRSRG